MIVEYLKLARSFNAVLTGISPVMGAIAMQEYNIAHLFLLFLVGFLGHTYGFVLNDIMDYRIDRFSPDLGDRPLVSGTISVRNAWFFASSSIIAALTIAFYISFISQRFFSLFILITSAFFITLYDLVSKRFPLTDVFVAAGIFFLILYGAATVVDDVGQINVLTWIVCILGSTQVLFMQLIAGGLKDIENDFRKGAKTLAVKMGVRVVDGALRVSLSFKILAYMIQLVDVVIVFLPFFVVWGLNDFSFLRCFQWVVLLLIGLFMFVLSHKLLSMRHFERDRARRLIGSHYVINFALVPVMLMSLNPWAGVLVFFPAVGFILSNLILHGTFLQPKTM
ncbi:MAG: hypothetical protein DRN05_01930 [Thermoplasmata archaeon]|nr:MAG: hypothetical protein DRN05_01930 [Thermoplasmata archaeon]